MFSRVCYGCNAQQKENFVAWELHELVKIHETRAPISWKLLFWLFLLHRVLFGWKGLLESLIIKVLIAYKFRINLALHVNFISCIKEQKCSLLASRSLESFGFYTHCHSLLLGILFVLFSIFYQYCSPFDLSHGRCWSSFMLFCLVGAPLKKFIFGVFVAGLWFPLWLLISVYLLTSYFKGWNAWSTERGSEKCYAFMHDCWHTCYSCNWGQ